MKDTDNIQELYEWVNSLYEKYSNDEITEEEYMDAYNFYTKRKGELENQESEEEKSTKTSDEEMDKVSPDNVRSTSIAGLRKKLMEEMKK